MKRFLSKECPVCDATPARDIDNISFSASFGTSSFSRQYDCGFRITVYQVDPYDPAIRFSIEQHCPKALSKIGKIYGIDGGALSFEGW